MVQDALAGKIDLIITKSVSRFARNTVDTLTTIRLLKEHGVEVYFEEQNIYSLDSKGELLHSVTIYPDGRMDIRLNLVDEIEALMEALRRESCTA